MNFKKKSIVVIFNYNLPLETDNIFNKLVNDGFNQENIIVVDNGSDSSPLAKHTNFALPSNIRFTGQAYMALTYLLDFYQFDDLLLITTSAGLREEINYAKALDEISVDINDEFGFITASLIGGETDKIAPEQATKRMQAKYAKSYNYQPIVMLISKRLLMLCRNEKAAYFNLALKRGWGVDRELQYVANKNDLPCYVSQALSVNWNTNLTHKKGLADESRSQYHKEANIEMETVLSNKYGYNWQDLFKKTFDKNHVPQGRIKKFIKKFLYSTGLIRMIYWKLKAKPS